MNVLIIFSVLLVFLTLGCLPSPQPKVKSISTTPTTPAPRLSSTPSASPVSLTTIIVTETNPLISPVTTATLPFTPTALPTFSSSTAKDILGQFVQENGGCRLPCVLGLTPGLSDQQTTSCFLDYFQEHAHESEDQIDNVNISSATWDKNGDTYGGIGIMFYQERKGIQIGFGYRMGVDAIKKINLFGEIKEFFETEDVVGTVARKIYGDPYFDEILSAYNLSHILRIYGIPSQIFVRPFPDFPDYPSPPAQYTFSFVLYYPEQGFLVEYITKRDEQGSNYVGCPTKPYLFQLSAWEPTKASLLAEAVDGFSNTEGITYMNWQAYKSLQEVTKMTVEEFYNVFKEPNAPECVQTQKSVWPTQEP